MANTALFASSRGTLQPAARGFNREGVWAYN
jgi:hypothetical protein